MFSFSSGRSVDAAHFLVFAGVSSRDHEHD